MPRKEFSTKYIDPYDRQTAVMFSIRVRYALQLLADLEVIGCCNLDWLTQRYAEEFSFDPATLKKVVVRLTLFGILHYEPGVENENLYLSISPEKITMYALVSAMDRTIDLDDPDAGEMPNPDNVLKEITVQHLIDAEYLIRDTTIREDASGRIWLAMERERKVADGEFMPMRHADCAAILAEKTMRNILKNKRIAHFHEVMKKTRYAGTTV